MNSVPLLPVHTIDVFCRQQCYSRNKYTARLARCRRCEKIGHYSNGCRSKPSRTSLQHHSICIKSHPIPQFSPTENMSLQAKFGTFQKR
ncbi:hypothetical protein GJ496_003526 [Pomphorhynchus laevis]|nr:hypothetical protein GJ496_003526 [Pomphorhynchus laevis]